MPQFARFSISTPSRHPANQAGYDSDHHRYRPDYVIPPFWVLKLAFTPEGLLEPSEGKITLPPQIASYRWTVQQVGGPFSATIDRTPSPLLTTEVRVPESGEYEITLQVNLTDGNRETSIRNYRLRDFLIVGIGDSFASGQGNPDVPAIAAPDQQVICKATSLAILATRTDEFLTGFAQALADGGKDLIEYLPFVGAIVVAELNGVGDTLGYIDETIDYLKDTVVSVGRDVEAAFVEGVEEIFGFGDSGGDPGPQPARWQEKNAYRSYRSGQSLAAGEIERQDAFAADRITFLSFARTGSEIQSGLLGPRTMDEVLGENGVAIDGWTQNRGQIAEASETVGNRPIDALIISIGINDVGFSKLVTNSILYASGQKRKQRIRGASNKVTTTYPGDLAQLKAAIENHLHPRHVFITEYPIGIFKEIADGTPPCGVLGSVVPNPGTVFSEGLNLDQSDAIDLGEVGALLNNTIRKKADEFGWALIDGIERGFDGFGYCAKKSFFVSAEESCLNQGDFEGMLHPNRLGHATTRDCIAVALRRTLFPAHWLEPVLHVVMVQALTA
jgi:hypothetical protein